MRRRESTTDRWPAELVRFDPADWGGGPDAAERYWDAHERWREAHGESVPIDPEQVGPDTPFDVAAL